MKSPYTNPKMPRLTVDGPVTAEWSWATSRSPSP